MHMVLATRHAWRSAFLHGPVIRSLADAGVEITLFCADLEDDRAAMMRALPVARVEHVGIRPIGESPAPFEWLVLSGRLITVAEEQGPVDILMGFEEDLASALVLAGRVAGVRLVVTASDRVRTPAPEQLAHVVESGLGALRAQARGLALHEVFEDVLHQFDGFVPSQGVQERLQQVMGSSSGVWGALKGLQQRALSVQMALHYGVLAARGLVDRRIEPLRQRLLHGAPVHWLLSSPPEETPPAGYTDLGFSTGLDVEAWIQRSDGRRFGREGGAPLRVGVWRDPWLRSTSDDHLEYTLRSCCARAEFQQSVEFVPNDERSFDAPEELEAWASARLRSLDVALVPGGDLHAAMQAQASGVAVVTRAGSAASRVVRASETGVLLSTIDQRQLVSLLASLVEGTRVEAFQREAQRRALRHFDYEVWLRRLTRELDARLTADAETEAAAGDDDGDLQGPLQRERRRHI